MECSAAALVFQIHGSMLRSACHRAGRHFEGLAQAARFLRQRGYISTPMLKKLIRIDDTFNVLRHITKESVNNYLNAFQKEIDSEPASRHIEDEKQACVKTKVLEDLPVPVEVLMKMDPDFSEIETKQLMGLSVNKQAQLVEFEAEIDPKQPLGLSAVEPLEMKPECLEIDTDSESLNGDPAESDLKQLVSMSAGELARVVETDFFLIVARSEVDPQLMGKSSYIEWVVNDTLAFLDLPD